MRRIIVIASLAVFVAIALAATLTTGGGGHKAPARIASESRAAPSHSRAFWVVDHHQP